MQLVEKHVIKDLVVALFSGAVGYVGQLLERAGQILRQQPSLNLKIILNQGENELAELVVE